MTFVATAILASTCDQLRVRDDAGNQPELVIDREGGSPLRCCLTTSEPGERIMLVSYAPLRRWAQAAGASPGAYEEVGPVFLHAEACGGPATTEGYPPAYRGWPRVLRAYDGNGRIVGGDVVAEGDEPEPVIEKLLADESVEFLHARALVHGCFTFWVARAG